MFDQDYRRPILQSNGRFTAPIAIDGKRYTVAASIVQAINRSLSADGIQGLPCDGFYLNQSGDVVALQGYAKLATFSNCFPVN